MLNNQGKRPDGKTSKPTREGRTASHRASNVKDAERRRARRLKPPRLTADNIVVPKWLNQDERASYHSVLEDVLDLGVATVSDRYAVQMLCLNYAQYIDACEVIAREGILIEQETREGNIRKVANPLLGEKNRLEQSVQRLFGQFGLMPKGRNSLRKDKDADADKGMSPEEQEIHDLLN